MCHPRLSRASRRRSCSHCCAQTLKKNKKRAIFMKLTSNNQRGTAEQKAIAELIEGSDVIRRTALQLAPAIVVVAELLTNALRAGGTMVSHQLPIPSANTTYNQQGHMAVIHVLCELIEESLTS